jgi:hypothetical protein
LTTKISVGETMDINADGQISENEMDLSPGELKRMRFTK